MTRSERETIIIYDDEPNGLVTISTCNSGMRNYLEKLCDEYPEYYTRDCVHAHEGEEYCWVYKCSKKTLVKPKKPRVLSDKQKQNLFGASENTALASDLDT